MAMWVLYRVQGLQDPWILATARLGETRVTGRLSIRFEASLTTSSSPSPSIGTKTRQLTSRKAIQKHLHLSIKSSIILQAQGIHIESSTTSNNPHRLSSQRGAFR